MHVQRVIKTVVPFHNRLDICGFLSPEGKDDMFEAISDTGLVSRVVSVIDAGSAVDHENMVSEIGFPSIDDQIKEVSLTRILLQGSLPGKYVFNSFLNDGLDLLESEATETKSHSRIDGFFSSRCNKQHVNE